MEKARGELPHAEKCGGKLDIEGGQRTLLEGS